MLKMKRASPILVIILLAVMVAGCGGRGKQSTDSSGTVNVIASYAEQEPMMQDSMDNDDFITVNVTKSYSTRKTLILQDFMDVEYIALETNDEFLHQGNVLDIGEKYILVRNQVSDGNIFIYDRHGKALRKINRKGEGPEEYNDYRFAVLDEISEEIFIDDNMKSKCFVYDLYGKFKRSFAYDKASETALHGVKRYIDMFNFDKDYLICFDEFNKETPFVLISKQDGRIAKEIKLPFKEKLILQNFIEVEPGIGRMVMLSPHFSVIPHKGNYILCEVSSDTVYTFSPDYSMRPFIARTPPVQSIDPALFLFVRLISNRYIFLETTKNEFNWNTGTGFAKDYFMYDRQEKNAFGYIVYNGDYATQEIYMSRLTPVNHAEIAYQQKIEAYRLVDDYQNGRLKDGKLKEIASQLDAEDNPVIMLVKHKK